MSEEATERRTLSDGVAGRHVVLVVYLGVVSVAGVMGAVLGAVNPDGMDPTLFFIVDLPATVPGMVVFGVVTVGVGLGVLLGLVRVVSRFDEDRVA